MSTDGSYLLNPAVRLRPEVFGGMAFDTRSGTLCQVDREAFLLLHSARGTPAPLPMTTDRYRNAAIAAFVDQALRLGILEHAPIASLSVESAPQPAPVKFQARFPWLSGPETVHWAITYRCDSQCPDCYAMRLPNRASLRELPTPQALELVDKIARLGAFQLAIGGGEPFALAAEHGAAGCVAGSRIIALAPDASVYPCSQLVHPVNHCGNLLRDDDGRIWDHSPVLRAYRNFRDKPGFRHSNCGLCAAKPHCGGCRAFAADGFGGDPFCPDPVLPPLTQRGKTGRAMDAEEYLSLHGSITVRAYMDRYGVSQERAVKELRRLQNAECDEGAGRKKNDRYDYVPDRTIEEIQEMIGCTSGGFPYATTEEIAEWIRDPDAVEGSYPSWILKSDAPGTTRPVFGE